MTVAVLAVIALIVGGYFAISGGGGDSSTGESTTATTSSNGGASGGQDSADFDPVVEKGGIPGGTLPVGVAADGDDVFIVDRSGHKLIKGSAKSMSDDDAFDFDVAPEDAVVANGSVFVTLPEASEVVKLSKGLKEEARIPIGDGTAGPSGIAVDGDTVWVAGLTDSTLYEIPKGATEATAHPIDAAQAPFGIAASGSDLWVADREGDSVIRFDPENDEVLERIDVGDNPKGVAVAGNVVYVANTDSGTVSMIGIESNEEIDGSPIKVNGQPRAIDVLGDHVWVSNGDEASKDLNAKQGWVTAINYSTHAVDKTLNVGGSPEGLGVGNDQVWVATGPEGKARAITP